MSATIATELANEVAKLQLEVRELEMLEEQSKAEIGRLGQREEQARARYQAAKAAGGAGAVAAADELINAQGRRMTIEAQLAAVQAKRKLLDRSGRLVDRAQSLVTGGGEPAASDDGQQDDGISEVELLQAVVATQEDERKRIARQVHDGPAQSMANVVLQAEISERLYGSDPERSREELASLRRVVKRTLQQLRGFIFDLRPMILDDLGLVPTLRRYVQTLHEMHEVRVAYNSVGRDARVGAEAEVAIFRLIQDSLLERIEHAGARELSLTTTWHDDALEIELLSDGNELPEGGDLPSGLKRGERLRLLAGRYREEVADDGTSMLQAVVPIRVQAAGAGAA